MSDKNNTLTKFLDTILNECFNNATLPRREQNVSYQRQEKRDITYPSINNYQILLSQYRSSF